MGDAVILLALLGIGIAIGYNVALTEGDNFRQRFITFFNLRRPPTR